MEGGVEKKGSWCRGERGVVKKNFLRREGEKKILTPNAKGLRLTLDFAPKDSAGLVQNFENKKKRVADPVRRTFGHEKRLRREMQCQETGLRKIRWKKGEATYSGRGLGSLQKKDLNRKKEKRPLLSQRITKKKWSHGRKKAHILFPGGGKRGFDWGG